MSEDKLRYFLKQVTANLHESRERVRELEAVTGEPIAVVGMGCRYPGGVRTPEDLWDLVASGRDAIGGFPGDRGWNPGEAAAHGYQRQGGFLYEADEFDADFFGISPREALAMDPQQRLLLEVGWETLERAGFDPRALRGSRTGVFVGATASGYDWYARAQGSGEGHLVAGSAISVLSGRISYTLGLNGPALAVDTACSSSLVSLHLAAQALRAGECSLALAGGVMVMATPVMFADFARQQGLASDGRCKAFADGADGTGWGEGAGLVLLERLSDARRLGHPVLAVIRGSALNQDGASNGLTAPSGPAQQRVIRAALADARLSAGDVDAVEAHGTGTELGDPIEAGALLATYGQERDGQQPLWLGSLKSNIGHTQTAAGVGGVIKMVLALQHGLLPRTLHAESPSRHVDWSAGNVQLLHEPVDWAPADERVRRAGVSAFGASGTNAHLILEEAREPEAAAEADAGPEPGDAEATPAEPRGSVWLVSGRSVVARAEQAGRLRGFVADRPGLSVGDVGWSLAVGRSGFEERAVVVGGSREELLAGLGVVAAGESGPGVVVGSVRGRCRVGFLFAGQGSQRVGMGRELYGSNAVFAGAFDEVCGLIEAELGIDLAGVVLGEEGVGVGVGGVGADSTLFAQTGLFAVEVALVAMLRSFGVVPDVVAGHSVGEVAAAFVAGVLSLGDAVRLVSHRARLMEGLPGGGAMAAVEASEEEIGVEVGGVGLSLAAVNGPRSVVVSGDVGVVDALVGRWRARGRRARRLRVSHAFHSAWVDPVLGELGEVAAGLEYGVPSVPWVGALSGELVREPGAAYWVAQARGAVRFADAVVGLVGEGVDVFVEVGPDGVLSSMGSLVVPDGVFVPVLRGGVSAVDAVVSALARVWVAGVGVEWGSLLAGQRVELPTYAFQRKRYWPQATTSAHAPALDAESRWRYRIAWSPLAEPRPARLSGTWLLSGESAEVAAALTERGAEVVTLDPARRERAALADALPRDLSGVVSVLPPDETPQDLADLLTLAQALGDAGIEAPLWVLTSGAVATTPGEPLPHPMQAQAWGLGRVFGLEFPERWGGLVDLPPDLDARAADHLVAVLAGLGEDQVAVRPSGLAVRRLERAPEPSGTGTWAPRGSVLVTGGTGALARHVTRWLTGRGAPHLVLTSRSGPSAAGVAAAAAELAGRGTAVDVLACDIAERPQVAAVLGRTPELCGVVHTAGVGQSTPAAETTPAEQAEVGRAKLLGARWLDELTADRELDVFVVFSSIAAIWGSAGQSGYAAANAGADALVEDRRARGLAGTSVAWGLWGGEAGLGAGADGTQVQRHGVRPMDPAAAVRALARAVDAGDGALTVADIDWQLFAPTFTLRGPSPLLTGVPEAAAALRTEPEAAGGTRAGELADRLGKVNGPERSRQLVALMRSCTADVLGHASAADIPPERAFKDLGFDSLTSVELRDRVAAATGLVLPATLVFDHPTPAALAAELDRMLVGGDDAGATAGARAAAVAVPGRDEPIAIVGLGLRMPGGVETPEQLWDLLASGTDAVGSFPADRGWRVPAGNYAAVGGFLRDATEFDAAFFGISPREALAMDPQQRLLLEVCWEALERAGIDPSSLKGSRTGVFAGAAASGYGSGTVLAEPGASGGHLMTGASTSVLSGRVSYVLGLTGPAVTVDTACSSSLVALHLAVQSLRSGECTLALAGGVTVMSSPDVFAEFAKQQVLAGDGRCKAFAAGADGTGWAEGAGVIAVERLSDAQRLGHRVLAVVRGTAANQDGASNGLTAPNGPSQRRVIEAALENAQLAAADVDAVEAHGTGTELGDPIEAQALLATYGQAPGRTADQPLWLGSVKSNIGHSQQAAGIAGVLKMVLALQHGMLPRTLHAQTPSPHVDWSAGHVKLLQEPTPWTGDGERVRRAGVSAFGISGTNVHVIVEEAPRETAPPLPGAAPSAVLDGAAALAWPVSGYDSAGRAAQAGRLREHVLARPEVAPDEVALSLAATRTAFEHRAVVLGSAREELMAGLTAVATGRPAGNAVTGSVVPSSAGRTVFVFPGQGSQWVGMGRELAEVSPVFAARLAECAAALEPYVDWELDDVLAGRHGFEAADVVQPALWAVMVSLAAVWQAAGVQPDAVVGHSQGEIAAAAAAGILSLDDAAKVVALRSKTLTALAGRGGMMAVEQTADTVRGWLAPYGERLAVAAVNGSTATVVSGEPQALRALADEHADTRTRILPVDYASHSAHVDELREEILTVLDGIAPREAGTPMISAMSGDWLSGTGTGPEYWYASLRETVEFARAVHTLGEQGHTTFLEVSPHPVLTGAIADSLEERSPVVVGTLRREDGGAERLLAGFAEAYVNGVPVDWTAVLGGTGRGPATELPTYAFQRERFWPEPAPEPDASAGNTPAEAGFWSAVESGDRTVLAKLLGVDPDDAALGALTSWRRRERADSAVADWRYRISWAPLAVPASARLTGGWLLVGEAPEVAELLAAHGARVCTVDIAGMDGTDRAALAAALPAGIEDLAGVVFAPDLGAAGADDTVPGGLAATLSLVQALGDAGLGAPLWVLTRGAVEAVPGEAVNDPTGAQIWALGRSVALEHPERWGGLIDLPADGDERTGARLAALLADGTEDQVALRGSGAYGRRLVRAPQPSTGDDTADWTPHGSVLVTGGTGAIGGHLARWLAERGAPRAVLTSRSGPSAAGAAALAADLAGAGTAVHVLACDLSERAAVAGLLDRIDATGPALSAVLHAAGVGSGGSVDELTAADLAEVSGAKVAGARWLDELMADRALDAFVLFSSGAAVWGGSGQPGYAAANGYLDGLAARRRAAGRPAIAVSWGLWGGGGLGAGAAGAQLSRIGVREMDSARALRALGRILGQGQGLDGGAGDAAVTVADIDWEIFAPAFTLRRPSPLLAALPEAARALAASDGTAAAADGMPDSAEGGVTLAERLAGRPRAEQLRRLVEVVRGEAAAVLGHAGAGALPQTRPFRKLGFDSVMAIDLRNRVAAASGLRLPATLVFDHPTPAELAEYLHGELGLGSGGAEAEGDGAEGGADPVLAGLDRLEAALAAVPGGSGARRDVTTRLRAVLSRWLGDGGDAQQQQEQQNKQQTVTGRLEDASAGEVLDFINQELGLS